MCRSILDHDPDIDVVILLVDRKRPLTIEDDRIRIIWSEDTSFPNYLQSAFRYNIIELNTALKPHVAAMLLRQYEKVIYLDPDTFAFNSLRPLLTDMNTYDVLLSPHALAPYTDSHRPNEVDLLRFGAFNLGFFAVRNKPSAQAMLAWWDLRCQRDCWYEPSQGLGVDQKWMDLAPSFFDGIHVIKHPGVNVAFWNLHERTIARRPDGAWTVNGDHPLIFVHFSSYNEHDAAAVAGKQTRYDTGTRPDFSLARAVYAAALARSEHSLSANETEYGYNRMSDGSMISPALRRFYAALMDKKFDDVGDPFDALGAVHAFARRHRLFSKHARPDKHINFKAEKSFGREKVLLDKGFRLALRVLGPDRYFMLMRYLAHYSSILHQADLFR